MGRNSSGTYTLPSPGVPFQSGTTISSAQVNATLSDLATETTSSLDRAGRGGMTAPLRIADGTAAAPAVAFTSEINSGMYRAGPTDVRLAVGGVDSVKFVGGGLSAPTVNTPMTLTATSQPSVVFIATGGAAGTQRAQLVYDTGGALGAPAWVFQNVSDTGVFVANGLVVRRDGLLQLGVQATPIQPASIWTAITPNANIIGTGGPAYFKDAAGMVHLKGGLTNNTGGVATTFVTTNPLPVGFRPLSARTLPGALSGIGAGSPVSVQVDAAGGITTIQNVPNSITLSLDAVSFMAEQ